MKCGMSGGLISREEVLSIITPRLNSSKVGSLEYQRLYSISEEVKSIDTSYDVERVIQQLEENKEDMIKAIERNSPSKFYMVKKKDLKELFEEYTREQIEIVKKGGV